MAVYITGDTHAEFSRFNTELFPQQKYLTKDDYIIICGDFGGVWQYDGESKREKYWLDWLNDKPWTTLFVSGNHENFWKLGEYPEKEWNGGLVNEIRTSVLHLKRGEIFNICNKTFFAFGGARSHDISDGILDPQKDKELIKKWNRDYTKMFRIKGISWWPEEMPTKEEMEHGLRNLENHNWKVDYIISHDCASGTVPLIVRYMRDKPNELNIYFEKLRTKCEFTHWYFGHYHDDKRINDKETLVFEKILRIL